MIFDELFLFESALGGCEAGDGHAEGGAAGVLHAEFGAELHAAGLTTVFATDTGADTGTYGVAFLAGHLDELTYTVLVEDGEGISLQNLLLKVLGNEVGKVVA